MHILQLIFNLSCINLQYTEYGNIRQLCSLICWRKSLRDLFCPPPQIQVTQQSPIKATKCYQTSLWPHIPKDGPAPKAIQHIVLMQVHSHTNTCVLCVCIPNADFPA